MRTTVLHSDQAHLAFAAWVKAQYPHINDGSPTISLQALRERTEHILGRMYAETDAETLMRTPNAFLSGETPWNALYHTPGGADRLVNVLDLIEQGRLEALPVTGRYKLTERRAA